MLSGLAVQEPAPGREPPPAIGGKGVYDGAKSQARGGDRERRGRRAARACGCRGPRGGTPFSTQSTGVRGATAATRSRVAERAPGFRAGNARREAARPPHSIHSVAIISCSRVKHRAGSPRPFSPGPFRSALRPLASTPDGRPSGVRRTLRDEGRSGTPSRRGSAARPAQTPPRREHAPAKGAGRPFGGRGTTVKQERAGGLSYDTPCAGDLTGVIRELAVPFTWTGIEDRSSRASAGVGSGLVPQCLRRPSVTGPPRGDEESGKAQCEQ